MSRITKMYVRLLERVEDLDRNIAYVKQLLAVEREHIGEDFNLTLPRDTLFDMKRELDTVITLMYDLENEVYEQDNY